MAPAAMSRWAVTGVATVMSTAALELAVFGGGALVAASPVFDGAPHRLALAFLAITYVVWSFALRVNLLANWQLLEATGTSTNAFSKAAYAIVRARSGSPRAMRAASMAGYLLTEAAKEVPYYAGAVGMALFSDSVDATDAVILLSGCNLGAALYEYGIARLVGTYLARRSPRPARRQSPPVPMAPAYASFEADWVPKEYLAEYYRFVEADERATIAYFVDAVQHAEPQRPMLVFGVGPTLHHVFLAAAVASEIHLAEYLPANLAEVERWLAGDEAAHDWRPFVAYTLQCEGVIAPTAEQIRAREELTRSKVTKLLVGDARRPDPLGGLGEVRYDTVISGYCAESATGDKATWEGYVRRIAGLVRPGGLFVTAALRNATGYAVGGQWFPCAGIDENDVRRVLQLDVGSHQGDIRVHNLSADRSHGYTSVVLARARRDTFDLRTTAVDFGTTAVDFGTTAVDFGTTAVDEAPSTVGARP